MLPSERLSYSPIKDRPRLALPGGARLVVWVIINVEEWNPQETLAKDCSASACGWFAHSRYPELGLA